jgi:hypothetical protein
MYAYTDWGRMVRDVSCNGHFLGPYPFFLCMPAFSDDVSTCAMQDFLGSKGREKEAKSNLVMKSNQTEKPTALVTRGPREKLSCFNNR